MCNDMLYISTNDGTERKIKRLLGCRCLLYIFPNVMVILEGDMF